MRQRFDLERLVDRADLGALTHALNELCSSGDFDELMTLRSLCRRSTATHRSIASVAALAEYRLALLAPAALAVEVLGATTASSAGPLTEVVAQRLSWTELLPHVGRNAAAIELAHERSLRGERIDYATVDTTRLDLPLWLEPWEPAYPLAHYRESAADFPPPPLPKRHDIGDTAAPGEVIGDPHTNEAFEDLTRSWTEQSNGTLEVVVVEGDHLAALATLGVRRARLAQVGLADALAHLAWVGASGGARGRRRGAGPGRVAAWACVAALGGLAEDWPVEPDDLRDMGGALRWFLWETEQPAAPWHLQLAVHDTGEELGMAVRATDQT